MTRRALIGSGAALVAIGIAVLGYVAWQYVGTNVTAEHRRAATVERLQERWRGPSASRPIAAAASETPIPADAFALVRIPRFGDGYVVPVRQGVGTDALDGGLGHFDRSVGPGRVGNFALAGHRVTHGQPLRDVDSLRPGDHVLVETARATYTYRIDTDPHALVVGDDAGWVVTGAPHNPDSDGTGPDDAPALLTLVTCAELFHTDERTVVFGHLVGTTAR